MRGKLITIEGCEGVGKSTQIRWLKEYAEKRGVPAVVTREPGGSVIAEKIRSIILDANNSEMSDVAEAMLYAAARAQHIKDIIEPNLAAGKLVICDRYIDSSLAYQGSARGLGCEFVRRLNALAISGYLPSLTVFLDLPPEKAFMRKGGADKRDRLERMDIAFHRKVYEGYKQIEREEPERFRAVDASGEKQETHRKIVELLKKEGIL